MYCIIIEPCHKTNGFSHMQKNGADLLHSDCAADQCLCFCYIDRAESIRNFQLYRTVCVGPGR